MRTKVLVKEKARIEVVATLWFEVWVTFLNHSVTKHLHGLWHTEGTLKGNLGLQRRQDVISSSGSITKAMLSVRHLLPSLVIGELVHQLIGGAIESVHLTEDVGIPSLESHLIAQACDVFGELLWYIVHLIVWVHLVIALSAHGSEYIVQSDRLVVIYDVVQIGIGLPLAFLDGSIGEVTFTSRCTGNIFSLPVILSGKRIYILGVHDIVRAIKRQRQSWQEQVIFLVLNAWDDGETLGLYTTIHRIHCGSCLYIILVGGCNQAQEQVVCPGFAHDAAFHLQTE